MASALRFFVVLGTICGAAIGCPSDGDSDATDGGDGTIGSDGAGGPDGSGGADATDAGVWIDIELDAAKTVASLTPEDFETICDALVAALDSLSKEGACKFAATFTISFAATDKVAACQEFYDDCVAKPSAGTEPGECGLSPQRALGCEVTVAELEMCINANAAAQQAYFDELGALSCQQLVDLMADGGEGIPAQPGSPPECLIIQTQCPGFMSPPGGG